LTKNYEHEQLNHQTNMFRSSQVGGHWRDVVHRKPAKKKEKEKKKKKKNVPA